MALLRTQAARAVFVLAAGLAIAAFLQAEGLRKQAETQPQGAGRRVAVELTGPLVDVSRFLRLTIPRHELQVAIGRQNEDRIDTHIRLTLSPPATTRVHKVASPPERQRPQLQPKPVLPLFTAGHPLTVWVAGDSLAEVPGEGLERVAPASVHVVGVESRLSTGLSRPDLYNWFDRFAQLIAGTRPDVAVLSFGADDAHSYMTGVPAGKTLGPFGSPSWVVEYRRRVDGVTRELNAAGIYVVWLGLPIPDGPGFGQSFTVINRILASVARAHRAHTTYVDDWDLFANSRGRFTPDLRIAGRLTLVRLPDGVHYTAAGGDLVARQVLAQLRRVYRLGK